MKFDRELRKGKLLKRYKRFFADIDFNGEVITAHTPNTGSMKTIPLTDTNCFFSTTDDPKRKLKHTLELVEGPEGLIGVNTRTPNIIVHEALENGLRSDYRHIQKEVKISDKTRIDFVLWNWLGEEDDKPKKLIYPNYLTDDRYDLHFIEVKNVTMANGKTASFPDSVSARGTKHLRELIALTKNGHSTEILYTVQREGADFFEPAYDIDPGYARTLKEAHDTGVLISVYPVELSTKKIRLNWADSLDYKI